MGLFDKAKGKLNEATNAMKSAVDSAKSEMGQMKADKEAHIAEMNEATERKSQEIINAIQAFNNKGGVFQNITQQELLVFTKDFYDKIFMPANSVSLSNVSMYPYITDKTISKLSKVLSNYDISETPIIILTAENNQEIVITDKTLYFVISLEEDKKYLVKGKISCDEISEFSVEINDNFAVFKCDEYILATFPTGKVTTEDFVTLNNYFSCIAKHDFTITPEEVNQLIIKKIGNKVYSEVKKYLVFDDEKLTYFAWGLDSLTAKDYIFCTDKQIVVIDREMIGATANVKQFYYEDITGMNTEQNSTDNNLTGFLIDTALTAATKTCDLIVSVAGSKMKIQTLCKQEAERVIAIYHQYRKEIKSAVANSQVIVQQTVAPDPIEQIAKLKSLLDAGVITEEEFNAKKSDLLSKL